MTLVTQPRTQLHPAAATRSARLLGALLVALCVVAIGLPSLYYPFGRDQGIHAFTALLAGEGHVVYRDVFNVKPPLTTVVHWLALALFGETMQAIRIMDLLMMTATALMLQSLVARHLQSRWLGAVAAIAFAASHYSNNYWFTAQTDGWASPFIVAAVLLYSRAFDTPAAPTRALLLCAAGALIGLAFWLKYTTAAVLLVFPAVHLAHRLPWRRIVQDGAAVLTGFLASVGLGVATLVAMGAFSAFLDIHDFMRTYAAHAKEWWVLLLSPLLILGRAKFATALAMLGMYALYRSLAKRERFPECVGLIAWLAMGWGSALLQGKVFVYHLLPLLPPLAIATAVGVHALIGWLRRVSGRDLARPIAAAACVLIVWLSNVPTIYRDTGPAFYGDATVLRNYWESDLFNRGAFQTRDNLALVDYLKRETLSCDRVFIWGYVPHVYFLSERRLVSRFIYSFPMIAAYYRQSYRDELMTEIAAAPPVVFIVEHDDRGPHVFVHNHDSAEVFEQFVALKTFVDGNYRFRERIARFDVYFRRDIDPDAARACPAG